MNLQGGKCTLGNLNGFFCKILVVSKIRKERRQILKQIKMVGGMDQLNKWLNEMQSNEGKGSDHRSPACTRRFYTLFYN